MNESEKTTNINEFYILGIDICEGDVSTLMIAKTDGSRLSVVNTIRGDDAERLYKELIHNCDKQSV
jgi:hypothetical protein